MSQVDQWPPHSCVRLSEAVGSHTVPAVNLCSFVNEVYELLPCANERTCFSNGREKKSTVTFLYVSGKGPKKLWQPVRIIGDYVAFCDKPLGSLAMLCFSRDPCTLSGL